MNEIEKVLDSYEDGCALSEIALKYKISAQKVRKILITYGKLVTPLSKQIQEMYQSGLATQEIAEELDMTTNVVNSYLPYRKSVYNSDSPSDNAVCIRKSRGKLDEPVKQESASPVKKSKKTVSARLRNSRSYQGQQGLLIDWANAWEEDYRQTIEKLRRAAMNDDHGNIMRSIDQLTGMGNKRYNTLRTIIDIVSDPTRNLKDIKGE